MLASVSTADTAVAVCGRVSENHGTLIQHQLDMYESLQCRTWAHY